MKVVAALNVRIFFFFWKSCLYSYSKLEIFLTLNLDGVGADKENRFTVVALLIRQKHYNPLELALHSFVYSCLQRVEETGDIKNRVRSVYLHTIPTHKVLKAITARIHQQPCRKQEILGREMKILQKSLSCF